MHCKSHIQHCWTSTYTYQYMITAAYCDMKTCSSKYMVQMKSIVFCRRFHAHTALCVHTARMWCPALPFAFPLRLASPPRFLTPSPCFAMHCSSILAKKTYSLKLFVIVNVSISLAEKITFETPQQDLKYC